MRTCLVCLSFLLLALSPLNAAQEDLASSYYHFSRAYLKSLDQDFKAALEEAEKAVELNPQDSGLRLQFAKLLFEMFRAQRDQEMFEKATEQAEKAIELDGNNAEAHLLLGQIYYRLQRLEEAVAALEKSIEADNDNYLAHYYAANIYMTRGDHDQAIEAFRNVLRLRPTAVQVYQLLASLLRELDRVAEAIDTLEDGLRVSPDEYQLLEMLAGLYRDRGEYEKAIDTYRSIEWEALADPQESAEVVQNLARLLYAVGRYEEALPLLQRLCEQNPQDLALQSFLGVSQTETRRFGDAVETLRAMLAEGRPPRPLYLNSLYSLARALQGSGDRAEAEEVFRQLRDEASDPDEAANRGYYQAARIHLALLAQRARRYDEAVELFRAVLEDEPDNPRNAIWLAFALKDAGREEEAVRVSSQLLEESPEDWDLRVSHAQLLSEMDRYPQAIELLTSALEKGNPESESPYLALNQIHLDHQRHAKALQALEEGFKHFPESQTLLFQRAASFERQEDFQRAEQEFRKLLEQDPDNHSALNYLGYMLADQGVKLEEALGFIKRAVEADPYNGAYLDSLGWAYFRLGKLDLAHKYLLQAIRLNENDPVLFEHLGDLYMEMENVEKARESYQSSLEFATEEEERERAQRKLRELLR
ncbi:MAG TPA: tetratricopeptide repeat protein [Acidobacteriota bacterium]|nr:tetratricopeptide repeat protein [Acidobacteriota bacterium]